LCADGGKEHGVETEQVTRNARNGKMAEMRRVEAAAEKGHAPRTRRQFHLLIVSRRWSLLLLRYSLRHRRSGSIGVTTMRWLIAVLAVVGLVVSVLALRVHYSTATELCDINEKWDCGVVNHSPFAEIAHVPVAALGIGGYIVLAGLALMKRRSLLIGLAVIALGFSAYLTYVEKYVLQVYCIYCVISAATITLIFVLSIGWLIAARRQKTA
jgi:vitamin-K-epoxide reductase (warfarin-sensitive)